MNSKSDLIFKNYFVDKIEYYNNESYNNESVDINAGFSFSTKHDENNANILFVSLKANIFKDALKCNYPFEFSLEITGEFEAKDVDTFTGNCLAILFPYLRAIISTYTAAANVMPLILPAINITKLLEENSSKEN